MMKKKKGFTHFKGEIHIKYPRKRGFFTWEELSCLARALGFSKDLFYKNTPLEKDREISKGLETQYLLYLLEIKAFHSDLHRTYNLHDAIYNVHVTTKAMDLLSNRYLSFQELREVRVAFQLYEHEDLGGMAVDEHVLLRTLKMCNRTVAPVKLMQHIKHMEKLMADRLTLYEFMDLLLICDRDTEVIVDPPKKAEGLDNLNLYNICDFNALLKTEDDRKMVYMNEDYKQKMLKVPSTGNQPFSWRDIPTELVDSRPRLEQVSMQKPGAAELGDHVKHSNYKVQHARCGYVGTKPLSARYFVDMNDVKHRIGQGNTGLVRTDGLQDYMKHAADSRHLEKQPHSRERSGTQVTFNVEPPLGKTGSPLSSKGSAKHYKTFNGTTPDRLSRGSRHSNRDILVSPRDLYCSQTKQETLTWDIATQDERFFLKAKHEIKEKPSRRYRSPDMSTCASESQIDDFLSESTKKLIRPYTDLERDKDDSITLLSPRKDSSNKETIYQTLMTRLRTSDTLLDFGETFSPPQSAPLMMTTPRKTLPHKPQTVPSRHFIGHKVGEAIVHFPEKISEHSDEEENGVSDRKLDYNVNDLIFRLQEAKNVGTGNTAMKGKTRTVIAAK